LPAIVAVVADAANPDHPVRFYTQAIRLKPDFHPAFHDHGIARRAKGDLKGEKQDYNETVRLSKSARTTTS
jgi:hypothetical protein